MNVIDIRSDTVSHPTPAMRKAMLDVPLGDDVFSDDPITNQLESYAAELLGKEAAIFVPTGVFGNQLAVFTHCEHGTEIILSRDSHIFTSETGALSIIAGVQTFPILTKDGTGIMDPNDIEAAIRKPQIFVEKIHQPRTSLLCVENALATGKVVSLEIMKSFYEVAKKYNLTVHLDGARIFNAATTLKCNAKDIAQYADSVMFCLSKGLCAPIGSMLVGKKEFIEKARYKRKLMGGGMRQTGILTICGLIALKEQIKFLEDDHRISKLLAQKLKEFDELDVKLEDVEINMVFFKIKKSGKEMKLEEFLRNNGILSDMGFKKGKCRIVVHFYIREKEVDIIIENFRKFFNEFP